MNFRTKTFALVAALALSMTITGGSASAQATTSATLQDTGGPRSCTIALSGGTNVGFGTFSWDGSAYTGTANTGMINVVLSHNGTMNNRHCNAIQVTGSNLTQGSDIAFNASSISVGTANGINTTKDAAPAQDIPVGQTASVPLAVSVAGVPSPSAPTGSYSGTITLSLSTAP